MYKMLLFLSLCVSGTVSAQIKSLDIKSYTDDDVPPLQIYVDQNNRLVCNAKVEGKFTECIAKGPDIINAVSNAIYKVLRDQGDTILELQQRVEDLSNDNIELRRKLHVKPTLKVRWTDAGKEHQ